MADRGILQLVQTDFTRYEDYQTRLQGRYKLCLCDVRVFKPSGSADIGFEVDIQPISGVLDNRNRLFFIHNDRGGNILTNKLQLGEVMVNGQFTFNGFNMGVLNKLILTIEYEKC